MKEGKFGVGLLRAKRVFVALSTDLLLLLLINKS